VTASLASLQRRFLDTVRDVNEAVVADVAQGRMDRDIGLSIYRNAYGARLREALGNDHALLGLYLGDALWDTLCSGYIAANPSRVSSLRDFGAALPAFLAANSPFSIHPQIAELAALERRLLDCFDAADGPRADWPHLQRTEPARWPGLGLRLHPSFLIHRVEWNSVECWQALKAGQAPPAAVRGAAAHWALWRDRDDVTRFRSLDVEEHAAVSHFLAGGDFAGLCDLLLDWHPMEAVPMAALSHLRCWCNEGWVSQWTEAGQAPALRPL
jgi:Putative DNA-binding domain